MGRAKLWSIVHLRLEFGPLAWVGVFKAPGCFPGTPRVQSLMHIFALFGHLRGCTRLHCQFQSNAIGVKEINALENMVVGHPQHLNAVGMQTLFGVFQLQLGVHAKRNVVDPNRGVGRGQGCGVVAEVKKSNEGAVLKAKEEMRVRAIFSCGGHMIALDDVVQRQTQNVLIKVASFFRVFGPVGIVVQLLNGGWGRQVGGVN